MNMVAVKADIWNDDEGVWFEHDGETYGPYDDEAAAESAYAELKEQADRCVVCMEQVTEGQEAVRSHIKGRKGICHAKHLSVRQITRARESGRLFVQPSRI